MTVGQSSLELTSPKKFRETELINAKNLMYKTHGGNDKVSCANLENFSDMETMVLRFEKGYEIPEHMHTKEVIEVLLSGRIVFIDSKGKSEIMETGMVRFCGPTPYRATILEDSYILVMQDPNAKVLVKESSPELAFFSQQLIDHVE